MTKRQLLKVIKQAGERLCEEENFYSCCALREAIGCVVNDALVNNCAESLIRDELTRMYINSIVPEDSTSKAYWVYHLLGDEYFTMSRPEKLNLRIMLIAMFHALVECGEFDDEKPWVKWEVQDV